MFLVNCEQLIKIVNDHGKTLDLCFSNTNIEVTRGDPIIYEDKHHPSLSIRVDTLANLKENSSPKYIFKNANYLDLNGFFLFCSWNRLYELESIDEKVNWFYNALNEGILKYVPVYNRKISNYPTWFTKELINKIREKNAAHTKYKKTNTKQQYNIFRQLRIICKNLSKECYNNYIIRTESMIKQDATTFWTYIKNKRRSDADIPATMTWKETTASNGEDVSNLFASFFKSIYKNNSNSNDNDLPSHDAITRVLTRK